MSLRCGVIPERNRSVHRTAAKDLLPPKGIALILIKIIIEPMAKGLSEVGLNDLAIFLCHLPKSQSRSHDPANKRSPKQIRNKTTKGLLNFGRRLYNVQTEAFTHLTFRSCFDPVYDETVCWVPLG